MSLLKAALAAPLYKSHKADDRYRMDGKGVWQLYYYPILGNGETQEIYDEPRALMRTVKNFGNVQGIDLREVPLRYIEKIQ